MVVAALDGDLPHDARIFWDGKLGRWYAKWKSGKWVRGSNALLRRFDGDDFSAIRHVAQQIELAREAQAANAAP